MDLPDVSSIAVLKGPQGTLFGRNATGGAIQIFTKDPQLNAVGGNIEVGYGNYNDAVKGFFTSPIVPGVLAGSVSGYYENSDNYYRSLTPNVPLSKIEKDSFRRENSYMSLRTKHAGFDAGYYASSPTPLLWSLSLSRWHYRTQSYPGSVIPTKP